MFTRASSLSLGLLLLMSVGCGHTAFSGRAVIYKDPSKVAVLSGDPKNFAADHRVVLPGDGNPNASGTLGRIKVDGKEYPLTLVRQDGAVKAVYGPYEKPFIDKAGRFVFAQWVTARLVPVPSEPGFDPTQPFLVKFKYVTDVSSKQGYAVDTTTTSFYFMGVETPWNNVVGVMQHQPMSVDESKAMSDDDKMKGATVLYGKSPLSP